MSLETRKFQLNSTANYSWSQNDELCLRILQFSCFRPLPMKESHRKAKTIDKNDQGAGMMGGRDKYN